VTASLEVKPSLLLNCCKIPIITQYLSNITLENRAVLTTFVLLKEKPPI